MNSTRRILSTLVTSTVLALSSLPALAGTFSISPLRVDLSNALANGALTVRNEEANEVVVQADAVLWEQVDGKDQLTPTRDVLVSPAVFTLPPGGSQLVRVALRHAPDAKRELTYRLQLQEVPQVAKPDFTGLTVALRLSLPIFVAPLAQARPDVQWSVATTPDGQHALRAYNAGTAHFRLRGFSAAPIAGDGTPFEQAVATYILAGQTLTWALPDNNKSGASSTEWRRLRVKGTSEAGEFEAETNPAAD
jgi:fimbrial chaperone protein